MSLGTKPLRLGGIVVALLALLAISLIFVTPHSTNASPASAPTSECAGHGFKIDGPATGQYTDGYLTVNLTVYTTVNGPVFDWTSNIGVDTVVVKGGDVAPNVYTYSEATSGTGLHSPVNETNPNNQYYGLSHVSFCYDYNLNVEKTAIPTYTRTYTWDIVKDYDGEYHKFIGDPDTSHGYAVSVTRYVNDSNYRLDGVITINNPDPTYPATIEGVSDFIDGVTFMPVDCGVVFPYDLGPGGTLPCTYGQNYYAPSGTNQVNVSTSGLVEGGSAARSFVFGDPTTISGYPSVTVNDTNGYSWTASGSTRWTYNKSFACSSDQTFYSGGSYSYDHTNTATIVETDDYDSATVTVHCYKPSISKTAAGTYDERHEWTIDKTVVPETQDAFIGESVDFDWTVDVDETVYEENHSITGTITVVNPAPMSMVVSLTDVLDDSSAVTISNCSYADGNLTVGAGATAVCDYSAAPLDDSATLNTATITLNGINFVATDTVDWTVNEIREGATVYDEQGPLNEAITGDDSFLINDSYTCSSVVTDYAEGGMYTYTETNLASVWSDGVMRDEDNASTVVNCYAPVVTKDAETTYDREYFWDIDKTSSVTELLLSEGQIYTGVEYTVTVWVTGYNDVHVAAHGTIYVTNPHPTASMTVAVADVLPGATTLSLDCGGSLTVAAGQTATCDYDATFADNDNVDRTNTATVTFNTINFATTADVDFGDPANLIDDCVTITDTDMGELGTLCTMIDPVTNPTTIEYTLDFGPYYAPDDCGEFEHINTAEFITDDTLTTGQATWTIIIDVACDYGCTLTPGYWKTHSAYGPAPYDDTWALLGGPDTPFFLSGQSYYEVLWTSPQGGNAYYILAHAYIAAELNFLNGALPSAVQADFDAATVLLTQYTPDEIALLKGKTGKEIRDEFIRLAALLDAYNNGLSGPGHCDEDGTSTQ